MPPRRTRNSRAAATTTTTATADADAASPYSPPSDTGRSADRARRVIEGRGAEAGSPPSAFTSTSSSSSTSVHPPFVRGAAHSHSPRHNHPADVRSSHAGHPAATPNSSMMDQSSDVGAALSSASIWTSLRSRCTTSASVIHDGHGGSSGSGSSMQVRDRHPPSVSSASAASAPSPLQSTTDLDEDYEGVDGEEGGYSDGEVERRARGPLGQLEEDQVDVVIEEEEEEEEEMEEGVEVDQDEDDEEEDYPRHHGDPDDVHRGEASEVGQLSAHAEYFIDESSDDEELTDPNHTHAGMQLEADSLADASPEEVEARARELLEWDEMGKDRELFVIDLKRWDSIDPKVYADEKTTEHAAVKEIQADLLSAMQELEASEWMYPEPAPFLLNLPKSRQQRMSSLHPLTQSDGNNYEPVMALLTGVTDADLYDVDRLAADPAAPVHGSSTPAHPSLQRSRDQHNPDLSRIHAIMRLVAGKGSFDDEDLNLPDVSLAEVHPSLQARRHLQSRRSLDTAPRRLETVDHLQPDTSFLESEAQEYLGDPSTSFSQHANFPWATPLTADPAATGREHQVPDRDRDRLHRDGGNKRMRRLRESTGTSSLARSVGVITL